MIHQQTDVFPEPDVFDINRFLETKINPYEWTPFGGGRRRCVGFFLAPYIMKIVLALMLKKYDLTLKQSDTEPEMQGVFYAPKGGPLVKFESRATHTT